jgi:hypothetical protein
LEATTADALPSASRITGFFRSLPLLAPRVVNATWAYPCHATSGSSVSVLLPGVGLAVAFYYGITAFACVWYFRRTHFTMRGLLPLLGGIGMAAAFIKSAIDMVDPEYGYTTFGPIGGVFVIGVAVLALGVPRMIACAVRFRAFFRAETLNDSMRRRRSW